MYVCMYVCMYAFTYTYKIKRCSSINDHADIYFYPHILMYSYISISMHVSVSLSLCVIIFMYIVRITDEKVYGHNDGCSQIMTVGIGQIQMCTSSHFLTC